MPLSIIHYIQIFFYLKGLFFRVSLPRIVINRGRQAYTRQEVINMPKDSQLDPKDVRKKKSRGGPTMAESALDGEGRNTKKQSAGRHRPGDDKKRS